MTGPIAPGRAITRFAPSPTGHLHVGHARAALIAAEAAGTGRFLLRIEDIDRTRCRPDYEAAIIEDLAWLGLSWSGPVRRQSEHFADYARALDRLAAAALTYPCFCSRADVQREIAAAAGAPHLLRHGPDGPVYPGTCRTLPRDIADTRIAAGEPFAVRLNVAHAVARAGALAWHDRRHGSQRATPEIFGDVVIARKDTPASYHLASVWDDALQGVTLVTRGEELLAATHIHCLLQALLDLPTPEYLHHDLLMGADGRKLSKRDAGLTLRSLRAAGRSPAEVIAMAVGRAPLPA